MREIDWICKGCKIHANICRVVPEAPGFQQRPSHKETSGAEDNAHSLAITVNLLQSH